MKIIFTVSASITSLKFLFPTIRFFIALTASLGLKRDTFKYFIFQKKGLLYLTPHTLLLNY